MSLLCDLRNFQYTITQINGLKIELNDSNVHITIPESQYDLIIKSLQTSNDYVFSLAQLEVNDSCSAYLVAIEDPSFSTYTSKTLNPTNNEIISTKNKGYF
jgi:hypothetical protein